jgi:hypothetical protein
MPKLYFIASLATLAVALSPGASALEPCPAPTVGAYKNAEYGFSFSVPQGLKGIWQSPCSVSASGECVCIGNHGLSFDLGNDVSMGVFADYAADLVDPTAFDVLLHELNRVASKDFAAIVHITALDEIKLRGRRGYRIHAVSAADVGEEDPRLERIDYVFWTQNVRVVIYLRGPRAGIPDAEPRLAQLLSSWAWASNNRWRGP